MHLDSVVVWFLIFIFFLPQGSHRHFAPGGRFYKKVPEKISPALTVYTYSQAAFASAYMSSGESETDKTVLQ